MALLFIDGFDHYDPQAVDSFGDPWLARGKAAYLSPQATRINGRRPSSYALRLPEGSGGGYVKNLDATKTSLIVGAAVRVVPYQNTYTEPLLLGVRDANSQVAHLVKIGEDGRLKLYRWQYGYDQLISVSVASAPARGWHYIELQVTQGTSNGVLSVRINGILAPMRQILAEAADRHGFVSPTLNLRPLRLRKTDVEPFTLEQVQQMLATVRADWRNYFTVRFFTGMRTGEVHGLKWKYIDFERRLILVRESIVLKEDDALKTEDSMRDIQMSQLVYDALKEQYEASGKLSEYVFCNQAGHPIDNQNFLNRIWNPLLRHLGLPHRRAYQMRHTAATLWLAAGEAPEWIARQLGHTSTEMLFRVYSRYVPNLTRQDGSAMERLLASRLGSGVIKAAEQPPAQQQANGRVHKQARAKDAVATDRTAPTQVGSPSVVVLLHTRRREAPEPKPPPSSRSGVVSYATPLLG